MYFSRELCMRIGSESGCEAIYTETVTKNHTFLEALVLDREFHWDIFET